jgi:hypothetical protein
MFSPRDRCVSVFMRACMRETLESAFGKVLFINQSKALVAISRGAFTRSSIHYFSKNAFR